MRSASIVKRNSIFIIIIFSAVLFSFFTCLGDASQFGSIYIHFFSIPLDYMDNSLSDEKKEELKEFLRSISHKYYIQRTKNNKTINFRVIAKKNISKELILFLNEKLPEHKHNIVIWESR